MFEVLWLLFIAFRSLRFELWPSFICPIAVPRALSLSLTKHVLFLPTMNSHLKSFLAFIHSQSTTLFWPLVCLATSYISSTWLAQVAIPVKHSLTLTQADSDCPSACVTLLWKDFSWSGALIITVYAYLTVFHRAVSLETVCYLSSAPPHLRQTHVS